MKIIVVADVLTELYYNGVIRASKKLDNRDFMQMARAAKGSIIRKLYYEEKQNNSVYQFIAANLKEAEYKTDKDKRGRVFVEFDYTANKIIRLPEGNGILRITAINEDGKIDYSRNFTKGIAGSEHLYCTKKFLEDTGEHIFMESSDQIRLFCAEEVSMVEMLAVIDNDDTEIPEDIVWEIWNAVIPLILRVATIPVDMTDDNNPMVQTIKTKLGAPQPL